MGWVNVRLEKRDARMCKNLLNQKLISIWFHKSIWIQSGKTFRCLFSTWKETSWTDLTPFSSSCSPSLQNRATHEQRVNELWSFLELAARRRCFLVIGLVVQKKGELLLIDLSLLVLLPFGSEAELMKRTPLLTFLINIINATKPAMIHRFWDSGKPPQTTTYHVDEKKSSRAVWGQRSIG